MSNYKSGEAYDATEFKGLDKYRKKDEKEDVPNKDKPKEQEEKKKPFSSVLASLPKPNETPKTSG